MKTDRWLVYGRWLALALWLFATTAFAEQPIPAFKAYVTDMTGALSAKQKNQLEQKLRAFARQKGSQIAVLIVPTTQPETIEQYSIRVAERWKPGRKGVDDGVLFVLAKNDRKFRIEVGYGLEGILPDAVSKRIDSEVIKPYFRKGDFYGGINAGADSLIQTINQEKLPAKAPAAQHSGGGWLVFIGAAVFGFILRLLMRPVFAAWGAGLIAALFGGMVGSTLFGFGLGLLAFALVFGVSYLITMMKRAREEKPELATSPPTDSGFRGGGYDGSSERDEDHHGFATGLGAGLGLGSLGSSSSDSSSSSSESSSSSDFDSGGDFGGGGGGDFGGGGASDSF